MTSGHVIGSGGVGYYRILESLEQRVAEKQTRAELAFRDFCERNELPISSDLSTRLPSAEWQTEVGEEPAWLAAYGRAADLLVVGRAREGKTVAMDVLVACLMETGRPMLIASTRSAEPSAGNGRHCMEEPARSCEGGRRVPSYLWKWRTGS